MLSSFARIAIDAAKSVNAFDQEWERRGSSIYGEDNGPGTAPFIIEFHGMDISASEIDAIVSDHNSAISI